MTAGKRMLGIIGCHVLEEEMAWVVAKDPDAKSVFVLDATNTNGMAKKIADLAPHKKVTSVSEQDLIGLELPAELSVLVWVKPIGLHQSPPLLREEVIASIQKMEHLAQSVLIFYGQCGNAFRNMEKVTEAVHVPVSILRDDKGCLVDDCTGTVLGGTDEYREFLIKESGVYVLNSMWAANWRNYMFEMQMLHDPNDLEEVRSVFEYMEYKKAMKLQTGIGDQQEYDRQFEEFANLFGLQKDSRKCTLKVVEKSYLEARNRITQPQV